MEVSSLRETEYMYARPTKFHDLEEYKTLLISGDENNCFFMAVFVSATIRGEPLGGDAAELASEFQSGRLLENMEEEGLRVRAAVVEFMRANQQELLPASMQPRSRTLTWENPYNLQYGEKGKSYEQYVESMSRSRVWGGPFQMRVLWAMGHKVTMATGSYKSKLRLRQHSPEFVELGRTDPVLWHRAECHFDVLVAPVSRASQ
jgi:hypothetical protein